jgi:hypothetical protein
MSKPKYDTPTEIHEAVHKARRDLEEIIPWLAEGDFAVGLARVDGVVEAMINIAKILHASPEPIVADYWTGFYATQFMLKAVHRDSFFEHIEERIPYDPDTSV